jgi:hypothetical protein|uniref:SAP domain-containing protein n=2 Tax=Eutreptiella gymnastica TaxID=73025 RepID=A0A7S4C8Q8_9EUGL
MQCFYAAKSKDELALPLNVHIPFNLKSAPTCPVPEPVTTMPYEKDGVTTRYFAKVMLLSGAKEEEDKAKGKVHLSKKLNFLIARKEHGTVTPIGGEWCAEKDGAVPDDEALQKTAIRVTKDMIGVDLSVCTYWIKFVEFRYSRVDGPSCTTIFVPNVWDHFADGLEPCTQVREDTKEVVEEVEEEEDNPEDPGKKRLVKKKVTTMKTFKVVEWRPYEMSLHNMLEYDCTRPSPDDVVELCLFADCFNELLLRDFGMQILEILQKKKEEVETQEKDKKRKREEEEAAAAEKKAKTENGEVKKEESSEDRRPAEPKKPKMKIQHTVNQEMLVPFQFFDKQPHTGAITGNLRRDVLEGTLHQFGTFTKHEIDDLLLKSTNLRPKTSSYNSAPAVLYYIKIATTTTEVPIPEEPEKPEKKEEKEEAKKNEDVKMEEEKPADAAAETPTEAAPEAETEASKEEEKADETPAPEPEPAAEAAADEETEENLNKLLLKDLRLKCTERGLSDKGKKAELIERLLKGE